MAVNEMTMNRSQKRSYDQKFRPQWLRDPLLKDWLSYEDLPTEDGKLVRKPKCLYCEQILTVRYMDLTKHCTTSKHLKNSGRQQFSLSDRKSKAEPEESLDDRVKEDVSQASHQEPEEEMFQETSIDCDNNDVSRGISFDAPELKSKRNILVSESGAISVVEESPTEPGCIPSDKQSSTEIIDDLRVARMRIELEQEQVRLYTMKLDALQKEQELGLPRSQFTRNL